jgi:hypothetical protein
MEKVKLTKKALNEFISWSTSRYNDYLGFGTKKQNVEKVFAALTTGNYKGETVFKIECSGSVGETYNGKGLRYWKTKQGGGIYTINCIEKTISEQYSGRQIAFN